MAGLRPALVLVAALCREGVAAAADPSAATAPLAEPAATDQTPSATIPAAPVTPPAAPPLVVAPAAAQLPDPDPATPGTPEPAPSTPPTADPRFGDAGQIALNGTLSASVGYLGYESGSSSNTNVSVEPAFDYFTVANLSQGATAFARYAQSTSPGGVEAKSTLVGVTGRIGNNFWLASAVSFWPKLAVGIWHNWLTYSAPSPGFTVTIDGVVMPIGPSSHFNENALFIEVQAPVLLHLARHFFVGFGPDAYVDVLHSVENSRNRRRFVGASSTIGGWF
jgi:hypothetical protein